MVRRSTWILLILFVLLAGFTFIFQRNQASKGKNAATATPTIARASVFILDGTQVDLVSISDSSGGAIEFKHATESDQWLVTGLPSEQVDSFKIGSNLAQLFTLTAQEILNQTPPLEAIGLELPAYTINMSTADGKLIVTNVGSVTPVGNGYYVRVDTGPIAIVDKLVMDSILDLYINPPLKVTPTAEFTTPGIILPTNSETKTTQTP